MVNALVLEAADALTDGAVVVDGFGSALLASLVITAIGTALSVVAGTNDDDAYTLRVIQRIARRSGERIESDEPGILYLEIDGLAKPILQRAMRDGNAPTMARWLSETHRFLEWETDLSSQTGASQAGILLGSNEDIPAFRWVEKERGIMMTCSAPGDCAEIERRHAGDGLLRDGGASRGQPALGRGRPRDPHRQPPGGGEVRRIPATAPSSRTGTTSPARSSCSSWEVILEWVAALRARRRDVQPARPPGRHLPVHAGRDVHRSSAT